MTSLFTITYDPIADEILIKSLIYTVYDWTVTNIITIRKGEGIIHFSTSRKINNMRSQLYRTFGPLSPKIYFGKFNKNQIKNLEEL